MWVQTADSLRVEELATIYMVAPELSSMRLEVELQHRSDWLRLHLEHSLYEQVKLSWAFFSKPGGG